MKNELIYLLDDMQNIPIPTVLQDKNNTNHTGKQNAVSVVNQNAASLVKSFFSSLCYCVYLLSSKHVAKSKFTVFLARVYFILSNKVSCDLQLILLIKIIPFNEMKQSINT